MLLSRANVDVPDDLPILTIGMGVEFDEAKNKLNIEKHGYSLESAVDLVRSLTFPVGTAPPMVWIGEQRDDGEPRHRVLTLDHEGQVVDFVFTVRGTIGIGDYRLRAISYRRAEYTPELLDIFRGQISLGEFAAWLLQSGERGLASWANTWNLDESVPKARRDFLLAPQTLDRVARMLLEPEHATAELMDGELESADDPEAKGYVRLRLAIRPVSEAAACLFDFFFNGCRGLRFYYALAPVMGALMERHVIDVLRPVVEESIRHLGDRERNLALRSLDGVTAKLFPEEASLLKLHPDEATPIVLSPNWARAWETWRADRARESYKAGWGIQAPIPSVYELKGAWVSDLSDFEYLPEDKKHRAVELHRWGWS